VDNFPTPLAADPKYGINFRLREIRIAGVDNNTKSTLEHNNLIHGRK